MSTYDVAVGLDEVTLNKALAQVFGHAGFQEKVARGKQQTSTPIGEINITWELKAPPTVSFAKVPEDRWRTAIKGLHDKELPASNVLTLVCPELYAEIEYADGARESDTTEVNLFAHLKVAHGKMTVDPFGVWVDQSKLAEIQSSALNALVFFGLELAETALTDLALPPMPSELGVELGPPAAAIDGSRLIVGLALKPGKVELTGGEWPSAGLFVLGSHALVNGLVRAQLHQVRGQTFTWRREALGSPGDGGAAVLEAAMEILEADVQVDAQELTQLGGTCRLALRGSGVVSLLKAVGLSALVRILEKIYLAWNGLGYGAQLFPSPLLFGLGLALEDRTVKVQVRSVRKCVALVWPRGSLPTILLSLVLWPVVQLVALIVPPVAASRVSSHQPTWDLFAVPPVTLELLGKPLGLALSGLDCSTYAEQLLIQGNLDLS